jgi:sn-glycerol 3-phosphate transport system permease protein
MVEHRPLSDIIAYAILTLGIFIVAFPVYLALIASTHDAATVVGGNMPLTPGGHMLDNYYRAIIVGGSRAIREPVGQMLMNSFISAIGIAIGKIFISILSAYAVVYFRFPFRKTAFWIIFVTLMLPVEVRIYPTYKVIADLKMLDTYAGLILPLIASATGTLLFRQFFMTIPEELLEASRIDGAGPFRFFWDTLLPLSVTTIAALFVIQFIYGWNQYLWPLLITTQDSMQTIVTGIKKMLYTTDELAEWQLAMATAGLVDEWDVMSSKDRGMLTKILNAGVEPDGTIDRVVGAEVETFNVFGPKAIFGIQGIGFPESTTSRTIRITLHRPLPEEGERLENFKARFMDNDLLRRMCIRWAADNREQLETALQECEQRVAQERAAPGQHHSPVNDIRGKFGRSLFQHRAGYPCDCRERL